MTHRWSGLSIPVATLHPMATRPTLRLSGLLLALLLVPPAQADIAVFTDGRILRVEDARLEDGRIVLDLIGGGLLAVSAERIDRVVEDEYERPLPAPEPAPRECPWGWVDEPLPGDLPFAVEIERAAADADLHPWLLAALVQAESAFDPAAVSRVGASGLTQLMPAAALDQGVANVFDPVDNLRGGARHLRGLLDRFESLPLALAAYNAGAATVVRYDGIPPYRETRGYVRRILATYCPEG